MAATQAAKTTKKNRVYLNSLKKTKCPRCLKMEYSTTGKKEDCVELNEKLNSVDLRKIYLNSCIQLDIILLAINETITITKEHKAQECMTFKNRRFGKQCSFTQDEFAHLYFRTNTLGEHKIIIFISEFINNAEKIYKNTIELIRSLKGVNDIYDPSCIFCLFESELPSFGFKLDPYEINKIHEKLKESVNKKILPNSELEYLTKNPPYLSISNDGNKFNFNFSSDEPVPSANAK